MSNFTESDQKWPAYFQGKERRLHMGTLVFRDGTEQSTAAISPEEEVNPDVHNNTGRGARLSASGASIGTEHSPDLAINTTYDNDDFGAYFPDVKRFEIQTGGFYSISAEARVSGASNYGVQIVGYDGLNPDTSSSLGIICQGGTSEGNATCSAVHVKMTAGFSLQMFVISTSGGTLQDARCSIIYDGGQ